MKSVALFVVRSRIRNSGAANRRDSPVLLLTHKVAEVGEIKEAKKLEKQVKGGNDSGENERYTEPRTLTWRRGWRDYRHRPTGRVDRSKYKLSPFLIFLGFVFGDCCSLTDLTSPFTHETLISPPHPVSPTLT